MQVRLLRAYPSNDRFYEEGEVIRVNEENFVPELMECVDPKLQEQLMAKINAAAKDAALKNEAARESKKGLSDKLLETLLLRIETLESRVGLLEGRHVEVESPPKSPQRITRKTPVREIPVKESPAEDMGPL